MKNILDQVGALFSLWIDVVAQTLGDLIDRVKGTRRIDVVENELNQFSIQIAGTPSRKEADPASAAFDFDETSLRPALPPEWAKALRGATVKVSLRPSRFVIRSLELPARATEFVGGIVRGQIDRLTPWNADESVYHWPPPTEIAGERIAVVVAAMARATAQGIAQGFAGLGATRITIATTVPDGRFVDISVHSDRGSGAASRWRLALVVALVGVGLSATAASLASNYFNAAWESELDQTNRRIASQQKAARGGSGGADTPLGALIKRKQESRAVVLVLEELSVRLPDHTYVREIRIAGDKVQIVGLTGDAASLIPLLEQSPHIASVAFFAPSTRTANEAKERFHIDARLKAHFGSGT